MLCIRADFTGRKKFGNEESFSPWVSFLVAASSRGPYIDDRKYEGI